MPESSPDPTGLDKHTPAQMAAWLRETAENTRKHSDPAWCAARAIPYDPLAAHVAFRMEQAADLFEAYQKFHDALHSDLPSKTSSDQDGRQNEEPSSASPFATERTPADYAIEHAGYLADAVETLLTNVEEGRGGDAALEATRTLRTRVYEFRKRVDFYDPTPPHLLKQGYRSGKVSDKRVPNLLRALDAKQAKIDALMMEFCPGEMPKEQRDEWTRHQQPLEPHRPARR